MNKGARERAKDKEDSHTSSPRSCVQTGSRCDSIIAGKDIPEAPPCSIPFPADHATQIEANRAQWGLLRTTQLEPGRPHSGALLPVRQWQRWCQGVSASASVCPKHSNACDPAARAKAARKQVEFYACKNLHVSLSPTGTVLEPLPLTRILGPFSPVFLCLSLPFCL